MKDRIFYEVDPHNRLVIRKKGNLSSLKKFRKVINGQFKTDFKNRLYYEVFKSSEGNIPQKIEFSGEYSLDKNHDIIFTLDKWSNQYAGNKLRLKTALIDANDSEMVFLLSSRVGEREKSVYTMKLYGAWQVDENNRLTFGVRREGDGVDNITLFNAWKVNKNNEIEYSYGRGPDAITFRGHWAIKDRYRFSYVLDKTIDSGFDFKVSSGKIISKDSKTYADFGIIIDISKRKRITRHIIFSCKWRLCEDMAILLELSPERQKGMSLKLTKEILGKRGLMYIESFIKGREKYIGGGVAFRW